MKPRLGSSGLLLVRHQRPSAACATADPAVCRGIGGTPQGPDSSCDAKPCHSCIFPTDCDDGNPCTADSCDPIRGSCQHASLDSDGDDDCDWSDLCPNTIHGVTVDAVGCPPFFRYDFGRDGDVDGDDLTVFEHCAAGLDIAGPLAGCQQSDSDRCDAQGNKDVDQKDFGIFQRCYSGADRQVNPHCVN